MLSRLQSNGRGSVETAAGVVSAVFAVAVLALLALAVWAFTVNPPAGIAIAISAVAIGISLAAIGRSPR